MSRELSPKEQQDILNHPALPIARALAKLGYKPVSGILDAAKRMMRTPALAGDLILYADSGQPAINYKTSVPEILFRPLPHGYSVATLIHDFSFRPVGAFLLASDLIVRPDETKALLDRFARDGVWIVDSDGRHGHFSPPAAASARQVASEETETGPSGEITPQDLVRFIERMEARGLPESPKEASGTANSGSGSVTAEVKRRFCPNCGIPLNAGKKFCPQCGRKTG